MVTEKWVEEENFNISEPLSLRNAAAGSARTQISATFCGANKMTNSFFHLKRISLSEVTRICDYPCTKQNQKIHSKRDLNGDIKNEAKFSPGVKSSDKL
jgi:hypothetical protein